jgi:hypothetical protein
MKIVTLTRPAPYPFGGKTLIPGQNRVDDEYLAELTANPAVQADISAGILQIGHGEAEPAKAEPAKAEPAKAEPAKAEPAKAEPVKTEPVKTEPAKK